MLQTCAGITSTCKNKCSNLESRGFDTTALPVRDSTTDELITEDTPGSNDYTGASGDDYTIMSPLYAPLSTNDGDCAQFNYPASCDACWQFTHGGGGMITITFTDMDIDDSATCNQDGVTITSTDGTDTGMLCRNNTADGASTIVTGDATVCWTSNKKNNDGDGFLATVAFA